MSKDFVKKEKVYHFLLDLSKELADKKLGGLFVISKFSHFKNLYEPLYPQTLNDQSLFARGSKELLLKLAELDGAFLIGEQGKIVAFGARIKKSQALPGYGTKHAAATGITSHIQGSTAILVSEENQWIKVFRDGKIIVEMDATKASPSSLTEKVISFITDNDTALLATAGASAAIAGVLPVVIVSGTYLAVKTASGILKKSLHKH